MVTQPIATGKVESLCINGQPVEKIFFDIDGPVGDKHRGHTRLLSGHDGEYIRTSARKKGESALNWRTWTGLSREELSGIEKALGVSIPIGCLLENITFSDIPNFSELLPTTRFVFPDKEGDRYTHQAILAVWEQNGPCRTVGERLARHHGNEDLTAQFVAHAVGRRGLMGVVLTAGYIEVGDVVQVYPPVQ